MTAQEGMKECLCSMLKERAEQDELFAESFYNSKKSMDECFRFIMSEVAKANEDAIKAALKDHKPTALGVGFDADWVMDKAVHYFDEAEIEVPESLDLSKYMPEKKPLPKPITNIPSPSASSKPYQAPIIPIQPKTAPKFGEDTLFFGMDDEEETVTTPETPNPNEVVEIQNEQVNVEHNEMNEDETDE